jgi:hypothetical protein
MNSVPGVMQLESNLVCSGRSSPLDLALASRTSASLAVRNLKTKKVFNFIIICDYENVTGKLVEQDECCNNIVLPSSSLLVHLRPGRDSVDGHEEQFLRSDQPKKDL